MNFINFKLFFIFLKREELFCSSVVVDVVVVVLVQACLIDSLLSFLVCL